MSMDRSPEPVAGPTRGRDDRPPRPLPTATSERELLSEATGLDALMAALIGPEPPAAPATQAFTDAPPPARVPPPAWVAPARVPSPAPAPSPAWVPPQAGEPFGFSTMVAGLEPVTTRAPDPPARSTVPFSPAGFDEMLKQEPLPAQGSSYAPLPAAGFEERTTQGWPNPSPRPSYASAASGRKGLLLAVLAVALLSGLGLAAWSAVSGRGDAPASGNPLPGPSPTVPPPSTSNETAAAALSSPSPPLAEATAPASVPPEPAATPPSPPGAPAAAASPLQSPARTPRTVVPAPPGSNARAASAPAGSSIPASPPAATAPTVAPPISVPAETIAAATEPSSSAVAPEPPAPAAAGTPPPAPAVTVTPAPASPPPAPAPPSAATSPANTVTDAEASGPPAAAVPAPARRDARLLSRVNPAYSATARSARISGMVDVRYTIDVNGQVTNVRATSGPAALRDASEAAVRQWRYEPALVNGQAVPTESSVRFSFGLSSRQ